MNAEDRRPLKSRQTPWARALAKRLAASGATANQISVAGIVFAALGCAALTMSGGAASSFPAPVLFLAAAACIQLRLLCNLFDGMVAVEGGRKGRAGDLFNEAPDRIADLLFFAGAGLAAGSPALGWAAAAMAVLTAYVRAFGASLGQGQDFCGPGAKQHRMFLLTLGCVAAAIAAWLPGFTFPFEIMQWCLIAVIALAGLTSARRIARLYRKLP